MIDHTHITGDEMIVTPATLEDIKIIKPLEEVTSQSRIIGGAEKMLV